MKERKVWLSTIGKVATHQRWNVPGSGIAGPVHERHQRVHAQHQVEVHVQQHAGVQRLLQCAVHAAAAVDGITGGNSPGSAALAAIACEIGTWSQPRLAERRGRLTAVQVGGHQHQALCFSAPEVVACGRAP